MAYGAMARRVTLRLLWHSPGRDRVAVRKNNFRRLLLTFEALSDLGTEMTASRDFAETARVMLDALVQSVSAREGVLFTFTPRPALLTSISVHGYSQLPPSVIIPLLPRHVLALTNLRVPQVLTPLNWSDYLSSDGNVSPELFKCVAPLRVAGKLVGVAALGRREDDALYDADEVEALSLLSSYIALAVHNHSLAQSLEQRIAEHLRLLGSMHRFYDNALEAFAATADINDENVQGHSGRVARYGAGIAEAMSLDSGDIAAVKAGGYLHDIGMISVDKKIFTKPARLDEREFREMADHTLVGHRIVSGVDFPWPHIPEMVRGHHERSDGSGYPDRHRMDETTVHQRVVALADTFDAMVSPRPWRKPLTVSESLNELVRLAPQKFDPTTVQGLLIQVRRDTVGSNKVPFLDDRLSCNMGVSDIDNLNSLLQHKLTNGRIYNA